MKARTWIRMVSTVCALLLLISLGKAQTAGEGTEDAASPAQVELQHGVGTPPGQGVDRPTPQEPASQALPAAGRPQTPGGGDTRPPVPGGEERVVGEIPGEPGPSPAEVQAAAEDAISAAAEDPALEGEEGAQAAEKAKLDCAANGAQARATEYLALIATGDRQAAYDSTAAVFREVQTFAEFDARVLDSNLGSYTGVEWTNCVTSKGGLRLDGTLSLDNGSSTTASVFVLGDAESSDSSWQVLDAMETDSVFTRIRSGNFKLLDFVVLAGILGVLGGLVYIIVSYARGLKGSPRELYLLFFTKVTEYSAYGAFMYTAVQYLVSDLGLSKMEAGNYFSLWSISMTVTVMLVGAVCDAIGIKNTLLVGCFTLLFARFFMPFVGHWLPATLLGFVPLAIGIAITGPVLKVGIKKYTTQEGAALGFGLFYTLMNVGFAIGGWYYQKLRNVLGETAHHSEIGLGSLSVSLPMELSTYQIIIAVGFFLTIPDLIAILWMRKGVERTEDGVVIHPSKKRGIQGSLIVRILTMVKEAARDTGTMLATNFREKPFWIYLFLLGVLVFVKITFFVFSVMFPSYMVSVFGPGARVDIFGVFNPLLIVFFVPLISVLTRKVKSYTMLLVGTSISGLAVFLVFMPIEISQMLADSWFGTLIYEYWIEVPHGQRDPFYMSLIIFIFFFTIGEAIWSPRLMQFSAEIAPRGREGSYIALAILPYFVAKFVVGGLSGWLLTKYTPDGQEIFAQHHLVWAWIGGIALFSPAGLIIFRKLFKVAEDANRYRGPDPEPDSESGAVEAPEQTEASA